MWRVMFQDAETPVGPMQPEDQEILGPDLADREALHQALVSSSPSPFLLIDIAGRQIVEANPAMENLLGYPSGALQGRAVQTIDGSALSDLVAVLDHISLVHHEVLGERYLRRRDDTHVPVEASGTLLIFQGRRVVALFVRDITDRRTADAERAHLEKQVAFAQKHEAVGRLAGGIAHDFNNLVTTIMLNAEAISLASSSPAGEVLEDILDACRKARDLTGQLLAFGGEQTLKPRRTSLNEIVEGMQRLLRRTIGEDVDLVLGLADDVDDVFVDPGQIDQVILNLVVNALDALPDGGTIIIATKNVIVGEEFAAPYASIDTGPHVVLSISDTGSGMDEDTKARIFEPFFSTKERGKGSGLGLSTVYGIVKQSGGHIWVGSEPESGTTFSIYFPRGEGGDRVAETVEEGVGALVGGTERILLVEDDDPLRRRVAEILRQLGYEVVDVGRPVAALELFKRARTGSGSDFDLVLTDVVMPEMSGVELVRHVHEIEPGFNALYMSGYTPDRKSGSDSPEPLLSKPFDREAIARMVRAVLDAEKAPSTA